MALLNEIIATNVPDLSSDKFPYKIVSKEDSSLILSREAAKPFGLLCSKILRISDWDRKFSQKFIEGKVESLIIAAYETSMNELEDRISELLNELESYNPKHEIILPIVGLRLGMDRFELGNVLFRRVTDETYSEVIERVNRAIDLTKNTDEEKTYLKNFLKQQIDVALKVGTLASVNISAEPVRALERAQEECGRSLDLLRFATPYVHQNPKEIGLGVVGEVIAGQGFYIVFLEDGSLQTTHSRVGSWIPFELNEAIEKKLQQIGVITLSDLLKREKITDIQKRVLSAVFWCAKAQLQTLPEFRLLCLMASLESILNPRGDRPVRMGIAEGVALLIGKSLPDRRNLRDFIARLYDLRSSVSHGGHAEVLESELGWLTSIAGAVIFELLKKVDEFKSQKELLSWIDDLRLA